MRKDYSAMIGQRFGSLVVTGTEVVAGQVAGKHHPRHMATAACDCGATWRGRAEALPSGHTKSCGCQTKKLRADQVRTHGLTSSPEYWVHHAMVQRCTKPNNPMYHHYGGRGIGVCDEWLKFENFYRDMGPRPSPKHTLERKDNALGYSPENCKWATRKEQQNNRRANIPVEHLGIKYASISLMCEALDVESTGLNRGAVAARLRMGWTVAQAVTKPLRGKGG